MANPLMPLLSQISSNSNLSKMADLMKMLKSSNNPMGLLNVLSNQNPELKEVLEMCNNKSPQQVFYELCKKKNQNPDKIMESIKELENLRL